MVFHLYLLNDFHLLVGDEESITAVTYDQMGIIVSESPSLTAPF